MSKIYCTNNYLPRYNEPRPITAEQTAQRQRGHTYVNGSATTGTATKAILVEISHTSSGGLQQRNLPSTLLGYMGKIPARSRDSNALARHGGIQKDRMGYPSNPGGPPDEANPAMGATKHSRCMIS